MSAAAAPPSGGASCRSSGSPHVPRTTLPLSPGSHLKVDEINASRQQREGMIDHFTANGLLPAVTNVKGGDCVLFECVVPYLAIAR